ncbi:MAG: AAA family ATPase [Ilumatobacteraceae bacterium]|nr:AAA family ATPase [Ilumatobacteraceae bacterium]
MNSAASDAGHVDDRVMSLVRDSRMIIVSGPGGVGKTTSAAALGVLAARHFSKRVLVLTVDPARRLATALGLDALGNAEVPVHLADAQGSLTMAMIDTKASWDDMVRRHAPDSATRERVLANDLYKTLTSRFVHSHDYVVTERLFDARETGNYDLVIVDTPPSRSALSVLDAPQRMEQFFSSRLLKLLTAPTQSRLLSIASRPFFLVADRILGAAFLSDIAEFFTLFRTMEGPIVSRARRVGALLADPATAYVVVTSAESVAMAEAHYLVDELRRRQHRLEVVLANRLMPTQLADGASARATAVSSHADSRVRALAKAEHAIAQVAARQAGALAEMDSWGTDVVLSESRSGDITDVGALLALGEALTLRQPGILSPRSGLASGNNGR